MSSLIRLLPVVLIAAGVALAVAYQPGPVEPLPVKPDAKLRADWFRGHIESQQSTATGAGLFGSAIVPAVYEPELHGQQ